jgi:hypothetical protein
MVFSQFQTLVESAHALKQPPRDDDAETGRVWVGKLTDFDGQVGEVVQQAIQRILGDGF